MIKFDGLKATVAHKYGHYSIHFHDLGIVYTKNPYVLLILSTYGNEDYKIQLNEISNKIYNFHRYYQSYKESLCQDHL